jgi:chromosome segregation ATPase
MARRGAPKRRKEPVEEWLIRLEASYARKFDEMRGSRSRPEFLKDLLDAATIGEVAVIIRERDEYKEELEKLQKAYADLEAKNLRLEQEVEKLKLIRQVLEEENRQLKQELAELRRQLKMSARERRAETFKQEIHEILSRYGKDGRMKMLELLKRLGYSSDFRKHARELLEEWFRDEGKILVSEELGLVVEKDPNYGEPAWMVKPLDSFRFSGEVMEVEV